jgi:tetratricopeptide (TPR) repeat protein
VIRNALCAALALGFVLGAAIPAYAAEGAAPSQAPVRASAAGWSQVKTADFTILGDVPASRLRIIGTRLEAFRATLEYLHPGCGSSPRETLVYVFARPETGQAYTPERLSASGHLGVNAPYDSGNYVVIAAPDDDPPLELLYHSYTHQFLDDGFPRLPLFVEEGLAEVYTRFRVIPEGTLIGLPAQEHIDWIRNHHVRPLAEELSFDASTLRGVAPDLRKSFVADSWMLMHWLLTASGDRRAQVPAFLGGLQRGAPVESSVQERFGTDLDGLREAMSQYALGTRFLPLRTTDASVRQDPAAFETRPLPRDEVLAALGDLIAHSGASHDADAETYFAEALRINPRQARAHAGLAALRCSRDRLDDAVLSFEKAIAIAPDPMSCYLLARSLLKLHASEPQTEQTPAWLARARTLLAQATTLRPGFAAPYVLLGVTHIRPDGDAAAGVAALEKARALLPARMDIAGNLVYLYLRTGDAARARATLTRVLEPSGDLVETAKARGAIATWEANADGQRVLAKNRADEEAWKAKHPGNPAAAAQYIQTLREKLPTVTDPKMREFMLAEIHAYEHPPDIEPGRAIEIFNDAIAHANKRDYAGAIAMLEDLGRHDVNDEMKQRIASTLEQLRKDAARLQAAQ